MIFISHDLTVINKIADRVVVMKNGQLIEHGTRESVLHHPKHVYEVFIVNQEGCVTLNDHPMHKKKVRRHQIGAVFQDYTSSLHPFQTVREILFEVMCQCDGQPKDVMEVQAITLLEEVGLSKALEKSYLK